MDLMCNFLHFSPGPACDARSDMPGYLRTCSDNALEPQLQHFYMWTWLFLIIKNFTVASYRLKNEL